MKFGTAIHASFRDRKVINMTLAFQRISRRWSYLWILDSFVTYHNTDQQAANLTQNKLSSDTVKLLGQWIQSCEKSHTLCNLKDSHRILPTRLIDVGMDAYSDVKPCHSRDIEPQILSQLHKVQYVTLSHSWGKLQFLTLISQNLDEFLVQIPVSRLRKTFQDAIALTRSLGYSISMDRLTLYHPRLRRRLAPRISIDECSLHECVLQHICWQGN